MSGDDTYSSVIKNLSNYSVPKSNVEYEKCLFWFDTQQEGEYLYELEY